MRVTCPACGEDFALEVALEDADARRLMQVLAGLDARIGRPLIGYLRLFKPASQRLRWSRALAIVEEVAGQVDQAQVSRRGVARPAPVELWADGLARIQAKRDEGKLTLPLKGNGLLLEIVWGLAEKAAGRAEAKVEESRRHATRPARPAAREGGLRDVKAHLDNMWAALGKTPPERHEGDDAA